MHTHGEPIWYSKKKREQKEQKKSLPKLYVMHNALLKQRLAYAVQHWIIFLSRVAMHTGRENLMDRLRITKFVLCTLFCQLFLKYIHSVLVRMRKQARVSFYDLFCQIMLVDACIGIIKAVRV